MIGSIIAKAMFSLRIWWDGSNDWDTGKQSAQEEAIFFFL